MNLFMHTNTAIVCNNIHEVEYVLSFCKTKNKDIPSFMHLISVFPYNICINQSIIGYVDSGRAFYYVSFLDFINEVNKL